MMPFPQVEAADGCDTDPEAPEEGVSERMARLLRQVGGRRLMYSEPAPGFVLERAKLKRRRERQLADGEI